MKRLLECKYCQLYANSSYLVCTPHPAGILLENNDCADFSPVSPILATKSKLFNIEDLNLAVNMVDDLGYGEQDSRQSLVTAIAELIHDPVDELLEQPLSDFFYYVLRLSQLLTVNNPPERSDQEYQQIR